MKVKRRSMTTLVAAVLVLGLSVAGALGSLDGVHAQPAEKAPAKDAAPEESAAKEAAKEPAKEPAKEIAKEAAPSIPLSGDPYAIADVVEKVGPAVVYIEVEYPAEERPRTPFDDPFFRDFFFPFNPWPDAGPRTSRGTGFIIDDQGHILTNQHVVGNPDDGQTITVKISTGSYEGEVEAELLGSDYMLDLAVLKIEKPEGLKTFPVAALGDSESSRPGEWVVAIGNPYGEQFEHTVTVGVLSAKGRKIQIFDSDRRQWKEYSNLMQTDAAINPGNSGGPLVNLQGEVIGINTAVNAAAQGIGFAIPINTALEVKDELITEGKVVREEESYAFLGVGYGEMTEQAAAALGLEGEQGVIIVDVVPDSAAAKAGLRVYDVVLRVGEQNIENGEQFAEAIRAHKPGDEVLLVVWRQGERIVVPVTLGDSADQQ